MHSRPELLHDAFDCFLSDLEAYVFKHGLTILPTIWRLKAQKLKLASDVATS